MAETPRREEEATTEAAAEQTPEASVDAAVAPLENRDAADPVISSGWMNKAKEFFETRTGKAIKYTGVGVGLVGVALPIYELVRLGAIFKFAKKFIEKKGKMTFSEGYEIGRGMFPGGDDGKKNKKG